MRNIHLMYIIILGYLVKMHSVILNGMTDMNLINTMFNQAVAFIHTHHQK